MPRSRHRFQTPPPADPIAAARDSSLALRLNIGFFLRQLGIFLVMDLLLLVLAVFGMSLYAENRCADVVELVNQRGVPSEDALAWMEASDYTITPLDRDPEGIEYTVTSWLPTSRWETVDGLRTWELSSYYTIELPNNGRPYAVTVDTSGIFTGLWWAGVVILICQALSLLTNLFRSNRSIRKVLRPIQDLAATAARLNSMTHMSKREIESLTGELDKIDAAHLDSRIDLPPTQKELRSLAQAINELMDRVNQAYSAQMRFVSDASHELRTPIAVIQGYAALLDRWGKTDPEALQESIDAIRGEAASMERLVEQLLFLARGDNDSQPVKMETLDLTDLAGEVLREEEMIHPERTFLPRWGEDPVSIYADPGLMKQLLRILMDNSLKYSPPEGRIYLRVLASQGHVRLTVQDEGMGIPPEGIPHIFERFYRTDQSRDRKTGGTGLGLSIAKWIVERHGGWFEVVSRPEVGTRITVVLPALQKTIDNPSAAAV
jgi:signal transduction histidine kinase